LARYEGMGVDIKALLPRMKSALEEKGYKIERTLAGATSFLVEYKKSGVFGPKGTISVKGTPDNFWVTGIRDDEEEVWFIVEDVLVASAANPQAFKSHTEKEEVKVPAAPTVTPEAPQVTREPVKAMPRPTSCDRCSAPLSVSQEDVIITCKYCGFTMTLATLEEIKKHSMLENYLHKPQVVETAKNYMDKGILRRGVAEKAQITDVKLRYVPFWVFPTEATTNYGGTRGSGMAQLREMGHAVTDKKKSGLSKFGKFVKAGATLALEQKLGDGKRRTVRDYFSSHYNWTTLARMAMISDINYYEVPAERKIPFDSSKIPTDAEFLNTELKEEETKSKVRAEVEIKQRELVSERVDGIDFCNTSVVVGEGELIHAPVWFVHYRIDEENYAIAVDGCTGKVLGGGRPLFKIK